MKFSEINVCVIEEYSNSGLANSINEFFEENDKATLIDIKFSTNYDAKTSIQHECFIYTALIIYSAGDDQTHGN